MLNKITIQPTEIKTDFSQLESECFIDVNKPLEKQPIALSMGYKFNEFCPIVTYGNFCSIVGASKSFKSFLKNAFLACFLGGTSNKYFHDLTGHQNTGKFVIDFDTEQSDYHVKKAANRVITMYGQNNSFYIPFALRKLSAKERVEFIEYIVYESQYKNMIALISIDGVADLVDNVNDLDKSNEITQKLMKITDEKKCAMITVIHKNYDSSKPTGHLGSAVLKKAETVLFVNKDGNNASVKAEYSRNIPIDEFSFTIHEGLPKQIDDNIF